MRARTRTNTQHTQTHISMHVRVCSSWRLWILSFSYFTTPIHHPPTHKRLTSPYRSYLIPLTAITVGGPHSRHNRVPKRAYGSQEVVVLELSHTVHFCKVDRAPCGPAKAIALHALCAIKGGALALRIARGYTLALRRHLLERDRAAHKGRRGIVLYGIAAPHRWVLGPEVCAILEHRPLLASADHNCHSSTAQQQRRCRRHHAHSARAL